MDSLAAKFRVFAPSEAGGEWNFAEVKAWGDVDLKEYINTEFPPKRFFLPDGEVLAEYDKGGTIKEAQLKDRLVIFGVRPCDTHALDVLDRVMLPGCADSYSDSYYKKRREAALIFALECTKAGEHCFCESMKTCEAIGFDLLFSDMGKEFLVKTGSEQGKALVAGNRLFKRAKMPELNKAAKTKPAKLVFAKRLDTKGLERIMNFSFHSKVWEDAAKRCLSCASCTSVCPTCYCFDIMHEGNMGAQGSLGSGRVMRTCSYCMLKPFTRVAGNRFSRGPRTERLKQFFYHKLVYGKENQGKHHCVGCGRCIKECMTRIDITEEIGNVRKEYERF